MLQGQDCKSYVVELVRVVALNIHLVFLQIKVCGLCDEIRSKVNIFEESDAEAILYMFVLCVRENYGGCGIAKKLVQVGINILRLHLGI